MNPDDEEIDWIEKPDLSEQPPTFMEELDNTTIRVKVAEAMADVVRNSAWQAVNNTPGNIFLNTTTNSNTTFSVTEAVVYKQMRDKLERIIYYTSEVRNLLCAVEVLDEFWDNGKEVVVIPKQTLQLIERLIQEISAAHGK